MVWLDLATLLPLLVELSGAFSSSLEELLLVVFSFERIPWLLVGALSPLLLVSIENSELVVIEVVAHVAHAVWIPGLVVVVLSTAT